MPSATWMRRSASRPKSADFGTVWGKAGVMHRPRGRSRWARRPLTARPTGRHIQRDKPMSEHSNGQHADGSMTDPRGQDPEAAHTAATAYTLDEVWCLAGNCRLFADISDRIKQCLESEDSAMSIVLLEQWKRGAQRFSKMLCLRRFLATVEMMRDEFAECSSFPWFCMELLALHHRWTLFAVHSKLNKIDWPCSSSKMLKRVDLFFDRHEVEYRAFQINGTRLLDAIKALDSFLENRRGVPVAIEAAMNGRAIEPPADRPELAAAAPSGNGQAAEGNGTAATNGRAPGVTTRDGKDDALVCSELLKRNAITEEDSAQTGTLRRE